MGKVYLTNSFSVNMLGQPKTVLEAEKINVEEFCNAVKSNNVINAIGHEGTAILVNTLCHTTIKANRIQIKAKKGDIIYIVTLAFRPEEGRVYDSHELQQLYSDGKIVFYCVQVVE